MPNLVENLLPQNISLADKAQLYQSVVASTGITSGSNVDSITWLCAGSQGKKLLLIKVGAVEGATVTVTAKVVADPNDAANTSYTLADAATGNATTIATVASSASAAVLRAVVVDVNAPALIFNFAVSGANAVVEAMAWGIE